MRTFIINKRKISLAALSLIFLMNYQIIDQMLLDFFVHKCPESIRNIFSNIAMIASTRSVFILSLLVIMLLVFLKEYRSLIVYATSMSLGLMVGFLMKNGIKRMRPCGDVVMDLVYFTTDHLSYSFPSGHAIKAVILFGFTYFILSHLTDNKFFKTSVFIIVTCAVIGIGLGQMMNGRHYFTDVLMGLLIGFGALYASISLINFKM